MSKSYVITAITNGLIPYRIPMRCYFLLAALTLGTMGFSNSSLGYLNYPTQVIFKCCKLLPVMAGSILIQGKRYGPLDFCAAVLMCVGLTLFTLGVYGYFANMLTINKFVEFHVLMQNLTKLKFNTFSQTVRFKTLDRCNFQHINLNI